MSERERKEVSKWRYLNKRPWHSPPHLEGGRGCYLLTASCFEHTPVVGKSAERLSAFSEELIACLASCVEKLSAWIVLPNHYHAVVVCDEVLPVLGELGLLHGRTSFRWNGEDDRRGRKVWYGAVERGLRSDAHLWATLNYVHHNAVKHGYVESWLKWPWSSAQNFLDEVGREEAIRLWRAYSIQNYGKGWDW
jgi:putative transposase